MLWELQVTITVGENQGKVPGGTGISTWSWQLRSLQVENTHKGFKKGWAEKAQEVT